MNGWRAWTTPPLKECAHLTDPSRAPLLSLPFAPAGAQRELLVRMHVVCMYIHTCLACRPSSLGHDCRDRRRLPMGGNASLVFAPKRRGYYQLLGIHSAQTRLFYLLTCAVSISMERKVPRVSSSGGRATTVTPIGTQYGDECVPVHLDSTYDPSPGGRVPRWFLGPPPVNDSSVRATHCKC